MEYFPFMQQLLLTVPQAANRLGISRSTLYLLLRNGDITAIKIGRSVRIAVAELERWIAAKQQEAESA